MSSYSVRHTTPGMIYHVWHDFRNCIDESDQKPRTSYLSKNVQNRLGLSQQEVTLLLDDMVKDGFLEMTMIRKVQHCSVPSITTVHPGETKERDWYCYECHGAGEVIWCADCPRVFHEKCVRKNIDLPLLPLKEPIPLVIQDIYRQIYGHSYAREDSINNELKPNESSINGRLLRDQSSRRSDDDLNVSSSTLDFQEPAVANSTAINEVERLENTTDVNDNHADQQYCVCCRLMKRDKLKPSANVTTEELNYLLSFVFERIRTWIADDTFSPQEDTSLPIPEIDRNVICELLLQNIVTAEVMAEKLEQKKYTSLTEFQCDLLNVQHCIGVVRGVNSPEYEAAKYLVMDGVRDLVEITYCKDCFRHSNEKNEPDWFAKPCAIAHELVYAKQSGYSYWPAKVIRKIANKYDVRFFGHNHTRAEIPQSLVKPLSTPHKDLKFKKSVALTKAMTELQKHQENLLKPQALFAVPNKESNAQTAVDDATSTSLLTAPKHRPSTKRNHKSNDVSNLKEDKSGAEETEKNFPKRRSVRQSVANNIVASTTKVTVALKMLSPSLQNNGAGPRIAAISTAPIEEAKRESQLAVTSNKRKRQSSFSQYYIISSEDDSAESTISDYIIGGGGSVGGTASKKDTEPNAKRAKIEKPSTSSATKLKRDNVNKPVLEKNSNASVTDGTEEDNESSNVEQPEHYEHHRSTSATPPPLINPKMSPRIKGRLAQSQVEKLSRDMDLCKTIEQCKVLALAALKKEVTRARQLMISHAAHISEIKQKHWCASCKQEAIYYCCWFSSYCSQECQEYHWQNGHKNFCKRIRKTNA